MLVILSGNKIVWASHWVINKSSKGFYLNVILLSEQLNVPISAVNSLWSESFYTSKWLSQNIFRNDLATLKIICIHISLIVIFKVKSVCHKEPTRSAANVLNCHFILINLNCWQHFHIVRWTPIITVYTIRMIPSSNVIS